MASFMSGTVIGQPPAQRGTSRLVHNGTHRRSKPDAHILLFRYLAQQKTAIPSPSVSASARPFLNIAEHINALKSAGFMGFSG